MKYVESACRTFTAGAALAIGTRVKLSSGLLVAAGLTDKELGVMETPSFASGDVVSVRLRTAQGTCQMIAAAAITLGAAVYTAASGKISSTATATGFLIGEALEAASGNGSLIEVLRMNHGDTGNP